MDMNKLISAMLVILLALMIANLSDELWQRMNSMEDGTYTATLDDDLECVYKKEGKTFGIWCDK